MSAAAISPIDAVHALSQSHGAAGVAPPSGVSPTHDAAFHAMQMAQQEQIFSMLMQNTQSSMMSQALQAPKDDDEDE